MSDQPEPTQRLLPGSERAATPDEGEPGLDPHARVEVTLMLRRATGGGVGADPADLATVETALRTAGAQILLTDASSRRIRAGATVAQLSHLFGADLHQVTSTAADGSTATHRARSGTLSLPDAMDGIVVAVLGLDDRPQAHSHFRGAVAASSNVKGFAPAEVARAYNFPAQFDGADQTIAIIELQGGYDPADFDIYFAGLGIKTPKITDVGVDGVTNGGGHDRHGADGEVQLDIQVAAALAPGANFVVYFAPNTDAGFLDAVSEAVHATPKPAAISISWGQSEDEWTAQARDALDSVFADAVTMGIVVVAAAGDCGSADAEASGNHADFPASSPNVLACGGTSLKTKADGSIAAETVWNGGHDHATGGGISDVFPTPPWQLAAGAPTNGRGVPDVAANGDPLTGYQVRIDGVPSVLGGTSAVAPVWSALIARLAQAGVPTAGFVPALYAASAAGHTAVGFHDVDCGCNGSYSAGSGWDACTGLGTPDATALLARLLAPPSPAGAHRPSGLQ